MSETKPNFTQQQVMQMLDAVPDGFASKMFFAALTGSAADHEMSPRGAVEFALNVCAAFMDIDHEYRSARGASQ